MVQRDRRPHPSQQYQIGKVYGQIVKSVTTMSLDFRWGVAQKVNKRGTYTKLFGGTHACIRNLLSR
jgi:hypothetical protein